MGDDDLRLEGFFLKKHHENSKSSKTIISSENDLSFKFHRSYFSTSKVTCNLDGRNQDQLY